MSLNILRSALYPGWVMHRRLRPRHHRFKYRVFTLLIDLDELPELDRDLRLFGWNRAGVFGFYDRDHGDGRSLKDWLDDLLRQADIVAEGPRRVLCYPRIFGYVFNPLSVWFCHDRQGMLKAVVHEVHNTYGERHAYVFATDGKESVLRHDCAKTFYVSPFLSDDCRYHFRVHAPDRDVMIAIQEEESGAPVLSASFRGQRRALTDRALVKMLFAFPLMTVKVIVAIHFEAVRLMLKGIARHPHRPARSGGSAR